jgi:hypothetical protein
MSGNVSVVAVHCIGRDTSGQAESGDSALEGVRTAVVLGVGSEPESSAATAQSVNVERAEMRARPGRFN